MSPIQALINAANREMTGLLRLVPLANHGACAGLPTTAQIDSLAERLQQVERALGRSVAQHVKIRVPANELADYVANLDRVQNLLLRLQPVLRAQRARLGADRAHFQVAGDWLATLKQTH